MEIPFGEDRSSSTLVQESQAEKRKSGNKVDLNDVFGGPSRRFSRYSFAGEIESGSESKRLWYGLGGDSIGNVSRRHTSDDFYDDIFKRSDEASVPVRFGYGSDVRTNSAIGLSRRIEKDITTTKQQAHEHKIKPLHSLLHEEKKMNWNKEEPNKSSENRGKSRIMEKVKEFVKVFKLQDDSSKNKLNIVAQSRSSRWKTMACNKNGNQDLDSKVFRDDAKMMKDASRMTELDSKVAEDNVKVMLDASFMVKERIEKHKFSQNRTIRKLGDVRFGHMDASPSSESGSYGSNVHSENINEPSLENFQVQDLSHNDDKLLKTKEDSEAVRASNSKIHLWSNGRKGNIRSLLSTLQYVLWPKSG